MAVALMDKAAGQAKLPETPAVVALFAFGSRLDRDTMQLFARTHSEEVRAAAIASTGQEVLELLHGGLRPQVLVLDALLTKPAVTQVLQEIGKMDLNPEPAVLVLVPVPEETAARRALGLFSRYEIMLRPYGMKNLFDEIYRMGTDEEENRLYRLRRCCEDVLEGYGAPTTLNGYRYAERMLLYALYAAADRRFAAVCRSGGGHRGRNSDLGAEPAFRRHGKARHRGVPGTLPAVRPPGGWRAFQRTAF